MNNFYMKLITLNARFNGLIIRPNKIYASYEK